LSFRNLPGVGPFRTLSFHDDFSGGANVIQNLVAIWDEGDLSSGSLGHRVRRPGTWARADKQDRDDDDDHGRGHGKGHDKDREHDRNSYSDHDRDEMRGWYREHYEHLPPGLAKRDRLPPGLERQLVVRGTLPPGLRKKIVRCPDDLERRLPPPPPECEHVVIGGHIVLLNRRTLLIVDVFHLEIG
jgi:hypothetical protein